ncbi:MAG: acylphosphatase [Candidatus Altiarchaeota archaeon]|nr:acylphosphatase [Candidatus Altiarchaeota archaeon]MBU4406787.1 acylphosphatase [Candidatus Altiarchaeota archaeon]
MSIKRARLIVGGDVMGVRYRDYVQKTGLLHGLKGSVENKPDRTVEIICEGEGDQVERFINEIKSGEKKGRGEIDRYPLMDVKRVDVYLEETPTNKFTMFDIKYGEMAEEFGDQIGASYGVLLDYDQYLKKMDKKYGEISVNITQSSEAIKILADALTTYQDALMEDREAIKELTTGVKDLVNEFKRS